MKIIRDKVILNLYETVNERRSSPCGYYPHIAGDRAYWQLSHPTKVAYAIKNENNYEKPSHNITLNNSLAATNFRVFLDTNPKVPEDERYKALGGSHQGKSHQMLTNCDISKKLEMISLQDHVWPEMTRLLFKNDFYHPCHANGLYIFKSKDGIKWEEYYKKPILNAFTECEGEEIYFSDDSLPNIFYDHNVDEYILYARCNIKLGVRHILYTKSKDLINWDKPRLINKNPNFDMEHENLYFMQAMPLPDTKKYIAFVPHFRNDIMSADGSKRRYYDTKTLVMISDNRVDWRVIDEIFTEPYSAHMRQRHITNCIKEGNILALYVAEGRYTSNIKLVRYEADVEEIKSLL